MIKASIIGASGYAGAEVARILCHHPQVDLGMLCSNSYAGQMMGELYPGHAAASMPLSPIDIETVAGMSDVVFTALPHGVSAQTVAQLAAYKVPVIDLSGDYRYDDPAVYNQWYGMDHPEPQLMQQAVYGLSEVYRDDIRHAEIIANPGCYTTCGILALRPLVQAGVVDVHSIIIDAKSGVTGAGRKPGQALHYCEVDGSFKAYKIANHRHTSEIEQELAKAAGQPLMISFTPHLLPVKRGILETIYVTVKKGVTSDDIQAIYQSAYGGEPFIRLMEPGATPELKSVTGSNTLALGYVLDERLDRLVVVAALDNLVKGAAGQAVQNMNIRFNLDETLGLQMNGWYL